MKTSNPIQQPATKATAGDYQPTLAEAEALKSYFAARERRTPRLAVTKSGIAPDHPSHGVAQIALMKAIGSTDEEFYRGFLPQLVNVGSPGKEPDESGTNFMLSVVKGVEPRDQIEAMLAAQMGAVHLATMTFARRLAQVENLPQQDSAERAFNKLARTFATQVSALKDYRSKGEQKMTVQHVYVSDGGRAIVGNVSTPTPQGDKMTKAEGPLHAIGHAPGVEVRRTFEKEPEAVSSAGRSGP